VPYFSTKVSTDANGWGGYKLDSIRPYTLVGDSLRFEKMNLKIFENKYYLENYDSSTNSETAKKFYSNDDSYFNNNKGAQLNVDSRIWENTAFYPSRKEYVKFKVDNLSPLPKSNANVESRSTPRMRIHLDKSPGTVFQQLLADVRNPAKSYLFENQNNFKNYFRGLYFQVDNSATTGALMTLNFSQGDVTIYYKQDITDGNTASGKEMASIILKMASSNTVNTFNNTFTAPVSSVSSPATNNSRLYLKGGQGSFALIDLFTNTAQFDAFKSKKILINDAAISFTVDETSPIKYPYRIYLYDIDNNRPLYDYYADSSTNSANPKFSKFIHGGILGQYDNYKKYKIKITELIKKIYTEVQDSKNAPFKENVRLGLVVTENINVVQFGSVKTASNSDLYVNDFNGNNKIISKFPFSSVLQTSGVVLYGNLPLGDPNYDKRIKFEINYTEIK